jgi:hypothetical protein
LAGLGNIYLAPVRQIDLDNTTFNGAAHDITAIALKSAGKFVKLEARVATKDVADENVKDAGGNIHTITVNAVVPNIDKAKSFLLEQYGKQKMVAIIELYEKTGSNRKAIVVGLDAKMKADAGANFLFNPTVEAEMGGVNGYNCSLIAMQGESPRFFTGAIVVEDGSTGTTVNLG